MTAGKPWLQHGWIEHSQNILHSYQQLLGQPLIDARGSASEQAESLFNAPFVVVSHGTQADPLLNYANAVALQLWKIGIPTLLQTPSRMTAEAMHRDERANLLARTTRDGYVDDYRGIRIATDGQRFLIERATVWNLADTTGCYVGQAATFANWKPLNEG
ncbi:MAG TPA: MEKHLA domain-containing protein [Rhodopirellula sp.]|nr:MEKHLA domain-containing protein [Rhodopirellula sp.]